MNIKNILKRLVPHYVTLPSVVEIVDGTKTEIESAVPLEELTNKDLDYIEKNPPTGVAEVQYLNWLIFSLAGKVVMSDIIPWDEYNKGLPEEVTIIIDESVSTLTKAIDDMSKDGVKLTYFEITYTKEDSPYTIKVDLSEEESE